MKASFLTYEQWIAENPDALLEQTECEKCHGDGVVECWHCYNKTECEECEGSGMVNTAKQQYKDRLEREKVELEKWQKVFGGVPA